MKIYCFSRGFSDFSMSKLLRKRTKNSNEKKKLICLSNTIMLLKEIEGILKKKDYQLKIRIEIDNNPNNDVITVEEHQDRKIINVRLGVTGFVNMLSLDTKACQIMKQCTDFIRNA